jgi:hypothetical protein
MRLRELSRSEDQLAQAGLGVHPPILLGFRDGALGHHNADSALLFRVTHGVHEEIQRLRPDVLIAWGPTAAMAIPTIASSTAS